MLRFRLVALVLVAGVLATGCRTDPWDANGMANLPADEIMARAKTAAAAAGSVHVKGRLTSNGAPVVIDIRVTQDDSAVGRITLAGQPVELIRVGQAVYVKGSDGFYRSIGIKTMPRQLRGKYLKVRAGGKEFVGLTEFTDIQRIMAVLLATPAPLVKGEKRRLAGIRAIDLVDQGGGRTVHVALEGEPLPLRISARPDGGGTDGIDFLEYNQPFVIRAPVKSRVVDINLLTKLAA